MKPDIGLYYEMVESMAASTEHSLSYLFRKWPGPEVWHTRARAKVFELLSFNPPKTPLNAAVWAAQGRG